MATLDPAGVAREGGYDLPARAEIPSKRLGGGGPLIGACIALVGIWAAMAPFAGPAFGYRVTTAGAWHWDLARAVLGLLPGAVAVACGLAIASGSRLTSLGLARARSTLAGLLAALCGAWLAIGPLSWPTLKGASYLHPAVGLAVLTDDVGALVGPGLLLAFLGGVAAVWARHAGAVLPLGPTAPRPDPRPVPAAPQMRLVSDPVSPRPLPYGGGWSEPVAGDPGATPAAGTAPVRQAPTGAPQAPPGGVAGFEQDRWP